MIDDNCCEQERRLVSNSGLVIPRRETKNLVEEQRENVEKGGRVDDEEVEIMPTRSTARNQDTSNQPVPNQPVPNQPVPNNEVPAD